MDNFYVRKHSGEEEGKTGDNGIGVSREPDKDVQNIETSGSDSSSVKGKNSVDQMENGDSAKLSKRGKGSRSAGVQEDDKVETTHAEEKQRRKRKRTIMNDEQIAMIEEALVDEPEMQRNAALIQSWADKLSSHVCQVLSFPSEQISCSSDIKELKKGIVLYSVLITFPGPFFFQGSEVTCSQLKNW